MIEFIELNWFEIIAAGIVMYIFFNIFKHGGYKNSLYGAKQRLELGRVVARKKFGVSASMVVHSMRNFETGEDFVGLELRQKAWLSFSMQVFDMSPADARELAELLAQAAEGNIELLP
ncbi:MAG: hypothetical protein JKY89_13595 [Immundisolibacteraceae bacterium]|nr:hypothetical protein [Immundisolibacteraceae bacterium]